MEILHCIRRDMHVHIFTQNRCRSVIARSRTSFTCSGPVSAAQPVPRWMIYLVPVGLGQAQLDIADFIGSRWMRLDPSLREAKKEKKKKILTEVRSSKIKSPSLGSRRSISSNHLIEFRIVSSEISLTMTGAQNCFMVPLTLSALSENHQTNVHQDQISKEYSP